MSDLSEFLIDLPSDPLEALHLLSRRGQIFAASKSSAPTPVDHKVAVLMGDTILDIAVALDLLQVAQKKDFDNTSGITRLSVVCFQIGQRIALRGVDEEAKGVQHLINNIVASAKNIRGDESFGYAFLDSDEKREIHGRLNSIRETVSSSNLNDRKKNAIFERLNALAKEVDTGGTSTDRFFAFMGDLAFVVGEMTTKAKPAIDETKEILRILTRARAKAEGIELPKPHDWTLLPPPKGRREPNKSVGNDDE